MPSIDVADALLDERRERTGFWSDQMPGLLMHNYWFEPAFLRVLLAPVYERIKTSRRALPSPLPAAGWYADPTQAHSTALLGWRQVDGTHRSLTVLISNLPATAD